MDENAPLTWKSSETAPLDDNGAIGIAIEFCGNVFERSRIEHEPALRPSGRAFDVDRDEVMAPAPHHVALDQRELLARTEQNFAGLRHDGAASFRGVAAPSCAWVRRRSPTRRRRAFDYRDHAACVVAG